MRCDCVSWKPFTKTPFVDPKSRTLRVRLAFDNPEGLLKANMFAEVVIYGGPKRQALAIPREALIETGERTAVVKALEQLVAGEACGGSGNVETEDEET